MSPWKKMGIEPLEKKIPYSANGGNWKNPRILLFFFLWKWSLQFNFVTKVRFLVQFFLKDAWEKARNKLAKCDPKQILLLKHFLFQDSFLGSFLSKCCSSLQSLTKSWDSLRGFMHYVETSGFEIASLPHSNSLRFFHFVGIWTKE